jgi:molybdate/tungstate transport system substrate-binding protein
VAAALAGRFLFSMPTSMLGIVADTLIIYVAASLTRPIQPVLDTFSAKTGIVVQRESGASLEHVRKITELHRVPDLLLLADAEVYPQLLVPRYATWYAEFARNRMVVAYTKRSKHAGEINRDNWMEILRRNDVEVGRADPDLAPVGYRTLIMFQLVQRFYRIPGLAKSLVDCAPTRNIRSNAGALAVLLAAGELDYIYDYQSVAESNGFSYVPLPDAINLGDPSRANDYAKVSVRVRGSAPGMQTELKGQPILYGFSEPLHAPHPGAAAKFLAYLISPEVVKQLRAAHVDMLDRPIVVGTGAPAELRTTK